MAILDGDVMMDSKHGSLNRRLYKYFLLIMLRKAGYNISAKNAGILAVKILQHKQEVEVRKRWLQVSYKNSSQFTQLKLILDRQKRKKTLSRFSFSASKSVVGYTKITKGRLWGDLVCRFYLFQEVCQRSLPNAIKSYRCIVPGSIWDYTDLRIINM